MLNYCNLTLRVYLVLHVDDSKYNDFIIKGKLKVIGDGGVETNNIPNNSIVRY